MRGAHDAAGVESSRDRRFKASTYGMFQFSQYSLREKASEVLSAGDNMCTHVIIVALAISLGKKTIVRYSPPGTGHSGINFYSALFSQVRSDTGIGVFA